MDGYTKSGDLLKYYLEYLRPISMNYYTTVSCIFNVTPMRSEISHFHIINTDTISGRIAPRAEPSSGKCGRMTVT
jgi:hypothetical protein